MSDKVTNWIEKIPKEFKSSIKKDATYRNHLIKQKSMILAVGQTGSGKTNMVVDLLNRSSGSFYEVIIFTGSNKDEPLYNFLASRIEGLKLIDKIEEMPKIEHYKEDDHKDLPKLIVFDDSVMLEKKLMKEIDKFYMMGRKLGFSCIFLSQDYHSVPQFIRRQLMYLILFKLNDLKDMKTILSKYCTDIDLDKLRNMLNYATESKGDFLTIAVNEPKDIRYRKNFVNILDPNKF